MERCLSPSFSLSAEARTSTNNVTKGVALALIVAWSLCLSSILFRVKPYKLYLYNVVKINDAEITSADRKSHASTWNLTFQMAAGLSKVRL